MIYSSGTSLGVDHQIFNRIFIGYLNNGDNYTSDITLFEGWVWDPYIILKIFDEDPGQPDDLLGYFWHFDNSSWRYEGDLIYDLSTWGDAKIGIYQEILDTRPTTASDVVTLMRPYLFTDVETSQGLNLEDVYGRVIYGQDPLLQQDVYCVQYFFYWSEEYTPFDTLVHFWDYEPLYYFINPRTSMRPYRIVFDNGFYWSGQALGDEQWWKCHEYTIYENLTLTGETAGVYTFNVNFTPDIAPLLGESQQLQFQVRSIDEIFDSSLNNWVYGIGGMDTPVITVETSYHSFDKGDADGGINWNFAYQVYNLTDQIIYQWFERLNISFYGGIHSVDGVATPWFSPFSYDIMNPFQRPYISNNIEKLLSDILTFNNAKTSQFFSLKTISDIKAQLSIPINAKIDTFTVLAPNQTFNPNITLEIDVSKAVLTIEYAFGFEINIDWWFLEKTFSFIKNGTILIDFSNPVFQLTDTILNTPGGYTISFSPLNFIEVEMHVTPQLLGTIFNATVRFKLLELIYTFIPSLRLFLNWFISDFDFVLHPYLEGYLYMDTWTTEQPHTHHEFTQLKLKLSPTIISPNDFSDFSIWIGNFSYGWHFSTEWGLTIDFTSLLDWFLNDIYTKLFTFPNIHLTLFSFTTNIALCTYSWNSKYDTYQLVS